VRAAPAPTGLRSRRARAIGSAVGLALFGLAIFGVWRQWGVVESAWRETARARWWLVAASVALPWCSCALSTLMYWFLMNRDDGSRRVGYVEMLAVISSAWLVNYVPSRPGMAGRLAYHRVVNDIPLRESVAVSILAITCAGVAMALLVIAVLVANATGAGAVVLAVPAGVLALGGLAASKTERARRYGYAAAARYADLLVWMLRYLCAFAAIGRPLSLPEAGAFTAISQAAMLVPLVSNGLGLREWAIGLIGPLLPANIAPAGGGTITRGVGLAGDIFHRAADIVASLPAGAWGLWYVTKRLRERGVPEHPSIPGE